MRVSDLIPPLGWLAALSSAATTGLWLQGTQDLAVPDFPEASVQAEGRVQESGTLRLPPPSDTLRAVELFFSRPLLAEGRRPFMPAPVAAEPEPESVPPAEEPQPVAVVAVEPLQIVMLGTVETGDTRRVLLRDELNGTETWHSVGDNVLGWTIVEILPDRTRLQLQGAEISFNLF